MDAALTAWLETLLTGRHCGGASPESFPALGKPAVARQHGGVMRFAELLVALVEAGRRRQDPSWAPSR